MNVTALDTAISCEDATTYLAVLFAASTAVSEWLAYSQCRHNGLVHGVVNVLRGKPPDDEQAE